MNIKENSLILKAINKLDIDETELRTTIRQSKSGTYAILLLETIQNKLSGIFENSFIYKNIDYVIMLLLSMAVISITFAPTGIIGVFILFAFLAYIFKLFTVKGEKPLITSFDVPIFLYIAIAGISVCFSLLFIPSLKGYIKMLVYFGGYLTFINIFKNNPKRILFFLGLVAITSSLESLYAINQQFLGIEPLAAWQDRSNVNPEDVMERVYGTLKPFNPNLLAGYLVGTFSSSLGLAFLFLKNKNIRLTIVSFLAVLAVLVAIIFTGSRGAYMSTAVMLIVFTAVSGHIIFHDYKENKILKYAWKYSLIAGILAILGIIASSSALQHRISSIFAYREDSSNSFRFNVYSSTLKMAFDNWLIGIGTGNKTFRLMYGIYMITGYDALSAYNIFLEIFTETGIFGLLSYIWMFVLSFIKSIKTVISSVCIETKIIVSVCIIGISGMMMHGMFDTIWFRPQINVIFWMLIAILAVVTHKGFKYEIK